MLTEQASPIPKGMGRKLRRARNVVKKWMLKPTGDFKAVFDSLAEDERRGIGLNRYERAAALILADKLRKS